MNRLNRLLSVCRLNKPLAIKAIQQTKANYASLPHIKQPGEGKAPISWKALKYVIGAGGILLAIGKYMEIRKDARIKKEKMKSIGRAAIGGPWLLRTTKGEIKKSSDFFEKWCLIYFGFTHCPDVCPDELEKMAGVVDDLEKKGMKIQPLFITVDPERDTPEALEKYMKEFSPKLIGLTGSLEQIKDVCKKFRVYYSAGPRDADDDYIVDHTIVMFLLNPDGEFVDYYGQDKKRGRIVDEIQLQAMKFEAKK